MPVDMGNEMKLYGKIFFVLLIILFCGCKNREKTAAAPGKILSMSAAATKVLYDLGVPPAAIDEYGRIAAGKPEPEVIGKGSAVSREKIAELGIDCVILWTYQQDAAQDFRRKGIQVMEVQPFRLRDYPALVRRLGDLTGKKERAEELCAVFRKELSAIPKPEKKKAVYFELYGPLKSVGEESYTGDLLTHAGGVVLNKKTGLISTESLLEHQPEIIFYVEGSSSAEEIRNRPGFSEFPAVKNNRIHAVPRRLITEGIEPLEAIRFFREQIIREK